MVAERWLLEQAMQARARLCSDQRITPRRLLLSRAASRPLLPDVCSTIVWKSSFNHSCPVNVRLAGISNTVALKAN